MAFKVRLSGQGQLREFGDDDGFEFLEGGVLAIHFGDEEKWAEFHPPTKWEEVTSEPAHLAGLNTPYVDDEDLHDDEEFDAEDDEDEYEDDDETGED